MIAQDQDDSAFAPLADAAWPAGLEGLRDGFAGQLNIYRVMAHNPALLAAWEGLRNHIVLASALDPALREIAILRTGRRWGSNYEWGQHVVRGRQAGLSDARIASCAKDGPAADDLSEDDRCIITAVDQLLDAGCLAADMVETLTRRFGRHAMIDLMATVGMYTTLAFIANSFAVPLEPRIKDILVQAPLAP